MKLTAGVFLGVLALSAAASAQAAEPDEKLRSGSELDGQVSGDDEKIRGQLEEMERLMREIRTTQDPERREELLRQHEEALRQSMHILDSGRDRDPNPGLAERMEDLQQRSELRQEMIDQMIDHQSQSQSLPARPYSYRRPGEPRRYEPPGDPHRYDPPQEPYRYEPPEPITPGP